MTDPINSKLIRLTVNNEDQEEVGFDPASTAVSDVMSYNNNLADPVIDLDGEHSGSEESFYAQNIRSEPQMDLSKQDSTNELGHTGPIPNTTEQQYFHAAVSDVMSKNNNLADPVIDLDGEHSGSEESFYAQNIRSEPQMDLSKQDSTNELGHTGPIPNTTEQQYFHAAVSDVMSYNNNQADPVIDLDGEHSGSEESFYAQNVRSEPQMDLSKQDSTNELGHTGPIPNTTEQQYFHAAVSDVMSYNNNLADPVIDLDGEHSGSEESFYAQNIRSEPQMDLSKQDSTNELGHTGPIPNTTEQQYFHAEVDIVKTSKTSKTSKEEEVKNVLKYICAFLNTKDANELIIRNKSYRVAHSKHLDDWCSALENKIRQFFFADNPTDFVRLQHGNCNSEYIKFRISPAKIFCSLSTFLYYPSITSNPEVRFYKSIEIMSKSGHPGDLFNIVKEKKYIYNEIVEELRGENINVQLKDISIDKILKDTPRYISGFANNIGGSIFFGIEDKNATVVGVNMTDTTEDELINRLEGKVKSIIWVSRTNSIKRGEHWNVEFFPIEGLPKALNNKRKIMVVSVAALPGGVFTAVPESFYLNEIGLVKEYNFTDWRSKMLSCYEGLPATKRDMEEIKSIVTKKEKSNVSYTKKTMDTVWTNLREFQLVGSPILTERNNRLIKESMKSKKCVILKGLIGTGKSELALRYCYKKSKEKAAYVWMLRCTDLINLEKDLRDYFKHLTGSAVEVDEREQLSQDAQHKVMETLAGEVVNILEGIGTQSAHIFLLDDVKEETKEFVVKFINRCSRVYNVKVIITSFLLFENDDSIKIIEISGFSLEESVQFVSEGNVTVNEKPVYEELVRKFSCNPKGLQIARTYMRHNKVTADGLLKRLKEPLKILSIENSSAIRSKAKDKKLFTSLIAIINAIYKEYVESGKGHVFDMFLMLPLLQVENIPVMIFSNIFSDCATDDLIFEIQNWSFGTVVGDDTGKSDNRLLSSHDVVVLAMEIYMELNKTEIKISKEDLLKSLLRSFFLLMDKDNRNPSVLQNHLLMLPHAKSVILQLNDEMENQKASGPSQTDFILMMIYINDLVGYTSSFSETCRDSKKFFDQAKYLLFCFMDVDEKLFDRELLDCCERMSDIAEIEDNAKKQFENLQTAMKKTAVTDHKRNSLHKIAKQFILGKRRNSGDLKLLQSKLKMEHLDNRNRLTVDGYKNLCKQGNAIPEINLAVCFLYELVSSVLYTYGRQLFYLPELCDSTTARFFCSYLFIAKYILISQKQELNEAECMVHENKISDKVDDKNVENASSTETKPSSRIGHQNFLISISIERSVIESVMDTRLGFKNTDRELLKRNLAFCKAQLDKQEEYLEFGTVKSCPADDDHNRFLWLKLITRIYQTLIKTDCELLGEGKQWAQQLSSFIVKMRESTAYPSLILTLGDFYNVIGENAEAINYFAQLMPRTVSEQKDGVARLDKHQRKACIKLITCRIKEPKQKSYDEETYDFIKVYKIALQTHKEECLELDTLEEKLKAKING